MGYYVEFQDFTPPRGAIAIDVPQNPGDILTLDQALAHATTLIAEDRQNVSIFDDAGNSITGPDLIACCRGQKTLSEDLRAN